MREVAEEELGEAMMQRERIFRELRAQTPGDQVHPVVLFRVSVNTWIEPPVRYLVDPKEAGRIR